MTDYSSLVHVAATTTALGTAWLTIRRIAKDAKKERKEIAAEILQSAKEFDQALKIKLESKIHNLDVKVDTLKDNIDKDIAHVRETYNSEIKFLGQKIESLREEVRGQHTQLVQLLTKMIEK
jgi:hypothetical protein